MARAGRRLRPAGLLAAALLAIGAVPGPDAQGAGVWMAGTDGVERFRAPRLLPVADQPWPFNGRITNAWTHPVEAWSDTRGTFTVAPGQSTPMGEDVDYANVSGRWYKIGPHHLRIDHDGQVTGYACPARGAGDSCG